MNRYNQEEKGSNETEKNNDKPNEQTDNPKKKNSIFRTKANK